MKRTCLVPCTHINSPFTQTEAGMIKPFLPYFYVPKHKVLTREDPPAALLALHCCQTTFLRQLPFLTSAAVTCFHLTVVGNVFSYSVMKYYTQGPGRCSPLCLICDPPSCHCVMSVCGFCFDCVSVLQLNTLLGVLEDLTGL